MELICQVETLEQLSDCSKSDIHSIIIYGPEASGKTYLAKKYADMLNIPDFFLIVPKVSELRGIIEECSQISTPVLLCIENLDTGVFAASSAILKFLEEPAHNIYIVVTARNIKQIQDTIISRSHIIGVGAPNVLDLTSYAKDKYPNELELYGTRSPWGCVRTFKDVDTYLKMNTTEIHYIEELPKICRQSSCVSDIVWAIQKYPDNKGDTPLSLVIRYIIYIYPELLLDGIECIRLLELKRIASYAILTKFAFQMRQKWGLIV